MLSTVWNLKMVQNMSNSWIAGYIEYFVFVCLVKFRTVLIQPFALPICCDIWARNTYLIRFVINGIPTELINVTQMFTSVKSSTVFCKVTDRREIVLAHMSSITTAASMRLYLHAWKWSQWTVLTKWIYTRLTVKKPLMFVS